MEPTIFKPSLKFKPPLKFFKFGHRSIIMCVAGFIPDIKSWVGGKYLASTTSTTKDTITIVYFIVNDKYPFYNYYSNNLLG